MAIFQHIAALLFNTATSSQPGALPQHHFREANISSRAILTSAKTCSSTVVLTPGCLIASSGNGTEIAFD